MLSPEIVTELRKPLDPRRVTAMTSGPAAGVPYLPAWDCIEQANAIFGPGGWSFELVGQPWIIEGGSQGNNHTRYEVWAAMGRVTVGDAAYSDIGTSVRSGDGSGGLEMAVKGAVSDALKRCLRMLGDQFGLVLYDKSVGRGDLEAMYRESQVSENRTPDAPATGGGSPWVNELAALMQPHGLKLGDLATVIPADTIVRENVVQVVGGWLEQNRKTPAELVEMVLRQRQASATAAAEVAADLDGRSERPSYDWLPGLQVIEREYGVTVFPLWNVLGVARDAAYEQFLPAIDRWLAADRSRTIAALMAGEIEKRSTPPPAYAGRSNLALLEEEMGRRGINRGVVSTYLRGRGYAAQFTEANIETWCAKEQRTGRDLGELAWEAQRAMAGAR